ncbi:MAG: zinc metallopeptidase [Sphingobacteriaceae bacterium]|nr:zinc metallopeptidase [Sphingobacteriaceae bacterium]
MYIILMLAIMVASWAVGARFKSRFAKYAATPLASGLSGLEIAQKMLRDHDIHDVKIISTEGQLTDHYNPTNKTVNLSHDVYYGRSVAAAAVSAHEVGHAVQHARAYSWLQFRSSMVPALSVASKFMPWLLLGGILTLQVFPQLLLIGIVLFALTTIFSFVTLPVEFDASRRALVWLNNANVTSSQQHTQAKDALHWAAMTYVIAALSSLATLLYYVMIYMGRRD